MIFYTKRPKPAKKGQIGEVNYDNEDKINFTVFPSLQGGPHNHQIAALAVALKQANTPHVQEVRQARNKVERVSELAHITLNKNAVFGDSSALAPGGVRMVTLDSFL
ncbi:hypothetical protein AXG93_1862s1440 [Marchantia polymorpha subsp. ruderalis]|uniref:Serine hydroxymethyltransferase-like domain-containing protein n=1 Tax=Marchantia polymorpha subsp. ruderalis TaxID=1480154 RepID=A0A176WAT2_MARPO|nr:hypothetical protein AXG93_1862s1440 [Marchantia polymorpha subsp. ruderalis]